MISIHGNLLRIALRISIRKILVNALKAFGMNSNSIIIEFGMYHIPIYMYIYVLYYITSRLLIVLFRSV